MALIQTVCSSDICDSNMRFFTNEWEEIEKDSLLPPITPNLFFDDAEIETTEFNWTVSKIDTYPLQFY